MPAAQTCGPQEEMMEKGFQSLAEVIDFAARREEEAHDFYKSLAKKIDDPFLQQLFDEFAEEEAKHQKTLLDLDAAEMERIFSNIAQEVNSLNIAGRVQEAAPEARLDLKQALILAMKREDKSHQLYSLLGELSADETISLLFVGLAQEEAAHRYRIEKAYQTLFGEKA